MRNHEDQTLTATDYHAALPD